MAIAGSRSEQRQQVAWGTSLGRLQRVVIRDREEFVLSLNLSARSRELIPLLQVLL